MEVGLGLWDSVEVDGWRGGDYCLVCVGLAQWGLRSLSGGKSPWLGRGQEDPGLGGTSPLVHLEVSRECLYSCKSLSESSSSTGSRRLCPERISDLSENLRELGLDGVLASEELRVGQAVCAGVARRLWEPGGGATISPWGIFPGYIRTAWELYKILVGSRHPHPLR